ncbi:5'(3')-deoxyribonucleotidase, partial [Staphylococcus aureus]|nr:5'(3')-deoxyribonucleotidase [Staphylococcus aureus]
MTRKSIAIDMDEVLADTVGALIEDVNKRTDLGITYDMLDGKKLRHAMPENDGLLHEILREPGFFKKLKVMAHAQEVVKKL